MFGISFGELLLIALIALLVLGPDRLPGAARTAGLWLGRLKRSLHAIKTDIEREIGADELRRHLRDEGDLTPQAHAPQRSDHPTGLAEPPAAARAGGEETARAVCSASMLHTDTSALPPAPPPPAATP